ncbi:MAG: hypothetical protein LBK99_05620 [Opitutaceae bacterium]|jgi:hypothetical protein|nr:hypothetical protein [Opitutaceae bacterium]
MKTKLRLPLVGFCLVATFATAALVPETKTVIDENFDYTNGALSSPWTFTSLRTCLKLNQMG